MLLAELKKPESDMEKMRDAVETKLKNNDIAKVYSTSYQNSVGKKAEKRRGSGEKKPIKSKYRKKKDQNNVKYLF